MISNASPQENFRLLLLTVAGQAFAAAGYALEDRPTVWAGGLFRFHKQLEAGRYAGLYTFIEFMYLYYIESQPARFNVTLIRTDQPNPTLPTHHADAARRDLSRLVVADFGVQILPSASHWWRVSGMQETGRALGEAGSLTIGYGMPWLAGDIAPPEE